MEQEILQVKKAGDFHYNIFFEKSFEKLSEKSYVPIAVSKFCGEFSTESFDATDYAGCISLAKIALEG